MKMKLLAMAVMATACGTNAFAAEVFNSGNTTLSIGGHVSVGVGDYELDTDSDVEVHQVSPRINIAGTQDLGNGVTVDAKGEWQLNYLDGGQESFKTRLGYIGATHDQYGRLVAGTQWSPYYDVTGVADLPIAFANDFLYNDHNNLGTARAERMLSYRQSLMLDNIGDLNVGVGWQGQHEEGTVDYDDRIQVALSLDVDILTLGYAYTGGDVTTTDKNEAESHAVAVSAGDYGNGFYGAAVFAMNDYMNGVKESEALELLLAYGLGYGMNLMANYEQVEDTDENDTIFSQAAIQLEYTITPKFVGFAGYQFDTGNDVDADEDDLWTIGARYYL